MQRPPATSWKVVRSSRVGRMLMTLSLAFAGVPVYGWHAGMPMARVLILVILWVFTAAWLLHYWRNMPQGRLRWDGEVWHWSGAAAPLKAVAIQYDFQTALWLLVEPAQGRRFGVWMDADPLHLPQWRAMRRALVACGHAIPPADDSLDLGKQIWR